MTDQELREQNSTRKTNLLGELKENLYLAETDKVLSQPAKEELKKQSWLTFYREVAYWAVEYIDELRPIPLRQPDILVRFYQLSEKERGERAASVFKNWEVENYERLKNRNKSNLLWLKQIIEWLPQEDDVSLKIVQSVIEEHSGGTDLYKKIKTFNGEVVNE